MKKSKFTFRKFITDIHLWLGIGAGIIIFLVCLSGTILTFEYEIEGFFDEKLVVVPSGNEQIALEDLIIDLESQGVVSSVTIKNDTKLPYEFRVKTSPKDRRGTIFNVNPYTGEVLKYEASKLNGFFLSMFKLHRWLLLDISVGRPIVGIATLIFLLLTLSGLVIWFPKKLKWRNFKQGFKIKFSANWKRINHDLHNTIGFYSSIILLIMGLTGLSWSFDWYRDGASAVMGAKIFDRSSPEFESCAQNWISLAEIRAVANAELKYPGDLIISFPDKESGIYQIRKLHTEDFAPVTADKIFIDRDGRVLEKQIFSDKPLNVQIASLIRPIHTGEIFGGFSKFIYFVACLFATSLPITGTIIWINKLKKKRKKRYKKLKR